MRNKRNSGLGLVGILLIIGALILTAGGVVVWQEKVSQTKTQAPLYTAPTPQTSKPNKMPEEEVYGVPNPAPVYCRNLGYKDETRTDEKGSQYGICIFPDGTECDDWGFFRGKCGQKFSYCEKQGFRLKNKVDSMGIWIAEYAVCVFNDKSECDEQDYLKGKCHPSECKEWILSKGGCLH